MSFIRRQACPLEPRTTKDQVELFPALTALDEQSAIELLHHAKENLRHETHWIKIIGWVFVLLIPPIFLLHHIWPGSPWENAMVGFWLATLAILSWHKFTKFSRLQRLVTQRVKARFTDARPWPCPHCDGEIWTPANQCPQCRSEVHITLTPPTPSPISH